MQESKSFYKKYKNQLIIFAFLFAAFFVIYQVIFPQIDQMQDSRAEIDEVSKKVATLKETLRVLDEIQDDDLDRYYNLTQEALPQVKDILLIFNGLLASSEANSVQLDDMVINLGDVYSREEGAEEEKNRLDPLGSPSVDFAVNIIGEVSNIRGFAQSLYRTIPIVEVDGVEVRGDRGELSAKFFYNPLKFTTTDAEESAKLFDASELSLLLNLEEWKASMNLDNVDLNQDTVPTEAEDEELIPTPSITVTPTIEITPTE